MLKYLSSFSEKILAFLHKILTAGSPVYQSITLLLFNSLFNLPSPGNNKISVLLLTQSRKYITMSKSDVLTEHNIRIKVTEAVKLPTLCWYCRLAPSTQGYTQFSNVIKPCVLRIVTELENCNFSLATGLYNTRKLSVALCAWCQTAISTY